MSEKTEQEMLEKAEAKIIERLKEIEEELYVLQRQDRQREENYQKKVVDIEVRKIEEELKKEADELKKLYPDFDVETELENPVFVSLVNQGLSMKTAYEAIHLDEIKTKGAEEAGKKAILGYKKNALRPEENGISLRLGGILKSGVHSLSKKDRAELAKRARKGEIITF